MIVRQIIHGYIAVARVLSVLLLIISTAILLGFLIASPLWLLATRAIIIYNWLFAIVCAVVIAGTIAVKLVTSARRAKNGREYLRTKLEAMFRFLLRLVIVLFFLVIEFVVFTRFGWAIGLISIGPVLVVGGILIFWLLPNTRNQQLG